VHPEQQRYWVSLLNLQQTWADDEAAYSFLPPRYRDFESAPDWSRRRALTFLLNNLELIRASHERLEAGLPLDWEALNHGLQALRLRLQPWHGLGEVRAAARAKADLGGRLETLQAVSDHGGLNPGTRYVRATVERSLYYFAHYVDERLADPAYPGASPGTWRVVRREGELALVAPARAAGAP
jgi:hypothetical protein